METTDDDPFIQYIVVRETLNMSPGKIGAQVGHAIMLFMECKYGISGTPGDLDDEMTWRHTGYTKILKRADDKEFERLKQEHQPSFVAVDLGRTEVPAGSETVMALWPMRKSAQSKTLKRLRLL